MFINLSTSALNMTTRLHNARSSIFIFLLILFRSVPFCFKFIFCFPFVVSFVVFFFNFHSVDSCNYRTNNYIISVFIFLFSFACNHFSFPQCTTVDFIFYGNCGEFTFFFSSFPLFFPLSPIPRMMKRKNL